MRGVGPVLAAAVALAACSSGGNSVFERLAPMIEQKVFGGPLLGEEQPAPTIAPEPTRAELNQIPYATIALRLGDSPRAIVVPLADNGGYLVYQDPARRSVVMHGGLVTATHGLGYDLAAVAAARDDPIAVPTPLPDWPGGVMRSYRFRPRGSPSYQVAVACVFQRGVREFIEIVELRFEVVRMAETCSNARRSFVNTYWADPDTGFIWKSRQWIGPRQPPVTIEIVRPYAPE